MLYSNFVELKGNGVGDDLRFVARAVGDDETRPFMRFILVEPVDETPESELRAVATDGRRLHMVEIDRRIAGLGFVPGKWRVVKCAPTVVQLARVADDEDSQKSAGNFPNYKKVIPEGPVDKVMAFEGFSRAEIARSSHTLSKFLRECPDPTAVNLVFLEALGQMEWTVEWRKGLEPYQNRAVVFKSGDRTAVIMPLSWE